MESKTADGSNSYILGNDHIISVPTNFSPNEKGLGYQLYSSMKKYSQSVAQIMEDSSEEDSYSQLLERCIRTALHLQSYNLEKDDIIMLCTHNHKNSCVPFIAGLFLGLQVTALDPTLSELEIVHLLKEVKPRILFSAVGKVNEIEKSLSGAGLKVPIIVFGESKVHKSFDVFLLSHDDEEDFSPALATTLEDPAVILYSSGTTGLPKGIVVNHYTLGAQVYNLLESGNIGAVNMNYATFYWVTPVLFLLSSIISGTARLICAKFDPEKIWYNIDKFRVTNMIMIPNIAISMLRNGRPEGVNTSSLWSLYITGASMSEAHVRKLRDQLPGTFVFQCYGQSEAGGFLTLFKTSNVQENLMVQHKPNSVGTPLSGLRYKVVNINNQSICGPYEQGELRIHSKIMMNGFYKKNSSKAFDSNGWLNTGDLVYFDEDFCFYFVERIKEILRYKCWQVPPVMIEQILLTHPAVQQALVIGIPHAEDGDHPMALIVPSQSYNLDITEEEIKRYVVNRAPEKMHLRGGVKFVQSLPTTPSGKIKRKESRDKVLNGEI